MSIPEDSIVYLQELRWTAGDLKFDKVFTEHQMAILTPIIDAIWCSGYNSGEDWINAHLDGSLCKNWSGCFVCEKIRERQEKRKQNA
jgi:hypothetical protein